MTAARLWSGALAFLALGSCDEGTAAPPTATPQPTCMAPLAAGAPEASSVISLDTTGGAAGSLLLTECWGEAATASPAPQAVVAYTVPGTGPTTVAISAEPGAALDVVLAARRGGCVDPAWARCFDVKEGGSAAVSVEASGGETLYLIVTTRPGGAASPEALTAGPVRLSVTASRGVPPTLESAAVEIFQGVMRARFTGADPDGDVLGALVTWLDPSGRPAGVPDDVVTFDSDPSGVELLDDVAATATDYSVLEPLVASARVALLDRRGNASDPLSIPVTLPVEVQFGEPCGLEGRCARQLVCTEATCQAPPEVVAACRDAELVEVPTPTTERTSATRTGALVAGEGLFRGTDEPMRSCYGKTPGVEDLYRVTVPEGRFDLVAGTDSDGPGEGVPADNVVYVRRTCEDPGSQPPGGCNDDRPEGGPRSRVELLDVEPGDFTVFVEDFDGVDPGQTYPYVLEIALRPVLEAAAGCDVAGVRNRCADGPCTRAGVCP